MNGAINLIPSPVSFTRAELFGDLAKISNAGTSVLHDIPSLLFGCHAYKHYVADVLFVLWVESHALRVETRHQLAVAQLSVDCAALHRNFTVIEYPAMDFSVLIFLLTYSDPDMFQPLLKDTSGGTVRARCTDRRSHPVEQIRDARLL